MEFDKEVKYEDIKDKLIESFNEQYDKYINGQSKNRAGKTLIYVITEMIQLINGSRICEAVKAFQKFMTDGYNDKISIGLARSGTRRKGFKTKERFRLMRFPNKWLREKQSVMDQLKITHAKILDLTVRTLMKGMYDHMQQNYDISTLSLRYAYVDYMIRIHNMSAFNIAKKIGLTDDRQIMVFIRYKREIGDYVARDDLNNIVPNY